MADKYEDVRQWTRLAAELRVKVHYRNNSELRLANGRSHDICESGMALYVPVEIGIGSTVELEFSVPLSRAPLRLHAVVRNQMGFRYGMQFAAISKAQREEIARYIESKSALQP